MRLSVRKSGEMISQRDYSTFYMYETATYTWLYQYLTDNVGVITTSERSFSAMRRVKSYLRSTMGNERLSNLSLMHIHRHAQVDLNMIIDNLSWLYQYLTDNVGVIATSERSFSSMRRVKSYLRSTMGNERLSNLSLMHIHRHAQVDLNMIIDNFSKTYTGEKQ
jgi:N-glycosylase/DNA lyase